MTRKVDFWPSGVSGAQLATLESRRKVSSISAPRRRVTLLLTSRCPCKQVSERLKLPPALIKLRPCAAPRQAGCARGDSGGPIERLEYGGDIVHEKILGCVQLTKASERASELMLLVARRVHDRPAGRAPSWPAHLPRGLEAGARC